MSTNLGKALGFQKNRDHCKILILCLLQIENERHRNPYYREYNVMLPLLRGFHDFSIHLSIDAREGQMLVNFPTNPFFVKYYVMLRNEAKCNMTLGISSNIFTKLSDGFLL